MILTSALLPLFHQLTSCGLFSWDNSLWVLHPLCHLTKFPKTQRSGAHLNIYRINWGQDGPNWKKNSGLKTTGTFPSSFLWVPVFSHKWQQVWERASPPTAICPLSCGMHAVCISKYISVNMGYSGRNEDFGKSRSYVQIRPVTLISCDL